MLLNDVGKIVSDDWEKLPERFPHIEMDEFVVMPNHMHGIIIVGAPLVGALNDPRAGTRPAPTMTLGEIVGVFKSITTNEYIQNVKNHHWPKFDKQLWQRNYYDHIIRDESALTRIRKYIVDNPAEWENDRYFLPYE